MRKNISKWNKIARICKEKFQNGLICSHIYMIEGQIKFITHESISIPIIVKENKPQDYKLRFINTRIQMTMRKVILEVDIV